MDVALAVLDNEKVVALVGAEPRRREQVVQLLRERKPLY